MARKVNVEVVLRQSTNGEIRPLSVLWEDGTIYEVDRLLHRCKAASTKVGGAGIRYTVEICGKQTYLFDDNGRWFMEAKN